MLATPQVTNIVGQVVREVALVGSVRHIVVWLDKLVLEVVQIAIMFQISYGG